MRRKDLSPFDEREPTRAEGIAYLTQCADDTGTHWHGGFRFEPDECPTCNGTNYAGHLRVPCSRYGTSSADCAPVAWRVAYLVSRESGEPITRELLSAVMSQVVNDSEEPAYLVREYGRGHYR